MRRTTTGLASRSSWRCAGPVARFVPAGNHRHLCTAAGQPPRIRAAEALRNIHRIAEIRLNEQVRRRASAGQRCVGLARGAGRRTPTPALPKRASCTVTYLTDAHRACGRDIAHRMRECGFDRVEIRRRGQRGGALLPGRARRTLPDDRQPLRHGAQRRRVRRAPGHFRAPGLRARAAPRWQAPALRHRGGGVCRRRRPALQGHLPRLGRAHRPLQPRLAGSERRQTA